MRNIRAFIKEFIILYYFSLLELLKPLLNLIIFFIVFENKNNSQLNLTLKYLKN